MRTLKIFLLAITLLVLSGCSRKENVSRQRESGGTTSTTTAPAPAPGEEKSKATGNNMQTVSLTDAEKGQPNAGTTERKIIRNADLRLETDAPAEGQRKIASIAEAHGGFVVSSDARQSEGDGESSPQLTVTVVVRVPAAQFGAVVDEIRATGSRVRQEKITGQDVTEEYMDLEARIRAKQALEAQFLEIMKQARSVTDALEVQRQLSEVRSEIERLEGRRRFLENQSSLSTITVTLQPSTPLVSTSGFFYSLKRAFGDGVDIAASITLFLIRLLVALVPIVVLIFLPIILLLKYLLRRWRRTRLAHKLAQEESHPVSETP
jgi:hypothetical protein